MTLRRASICLTITLILLAAAAAANARAAGPTAQSAANDDTLRLLVIELFFLLVGLAVAAFLGYLVWQSWRRKKKKALEKKK